ncbi:serine/threonine-protein kinase [Nocardioides limicola]|uniref:serine/threonine-protein kinase n=1 Tax=Nocardioides limicola TaxID=2803368 RepID=UPI00193C5DFD|nr:serine/threonine-protein kinase [Nocardioides sp. DJM-14]
MGRLSNGGMGSVWLATDTLLERQVAVKRIVAEADEGTRERARREAQLAASLSHPGVVAVFDLVAEGDELWLVMEYVDGASLAQIVRRDGPLSPDVAAGLIGQVAGGLAAAHRAGIVHRDVKPGNVFVTSDGHAKLGDFGISRSLADQSATRTGLVTGSPAYLAPEVASGHRAEPASDVWSLGATLFHAVSGRAPFDAGEVTATMHQVVHSPPPRLPESGWVARAIEHTLTTDPAQRWTAQDVRNYLASLGTMGPPSRSTDSPTHAAAEPTRRLASPAVTGATLVIDAPEQSAPVTAEVLTDQEVEDEDEEWEEPLIVVTPTLAAAALLSVLLVVLVGWWWVTGDPANAPRRIAEEIAISTGQDAAPVVTPDPALEDVTDDDIVEFIRAYVDAAVHNTREGYRMLTPEYQSDSGGFTGYRGWWSQFLSASVSDVRPDAEAMRVAYRIEYVRDDGSTFAEQVHLDLELRNGRLVIAGHQ